LTIYARLQQTLGVGSGENALRHFKGAYRVDDAFIALTRSVYITSDQRADLKRQINARLGSTTVEKKSYKLCAALAW
jgi:hypothetical protein